MRQRNELTVKSGRLVLYAASCMSWSCLADTINGYMPLGKEGKRDEYDDSKMGKSGTRLCATAMSMGIIMVVPLRLPLMRSGYFWATGFGWSILVLAFCAQRPVNSVDARSITATADDPNMADMVGLRKLDEAIDTLRALGI